MRRRRRKRERRERKVERKERKKKQRGRREGGGGGREDEKEVEAMGEGRKRRGEEMNDLYLRDSYGGLSRSLNLHAPSVPHRLGPADIHVDQQQVGVIEVKLTIFPRVSKTDTQELLDLPVRGEGEGEGGKDRGDGGMYEYILQLRTVCVCEHFSRRLLSPGPGGHV